MSEPSYTMALERQTIPIQWKPISRTPAQFKYKSCPRCVGTLYSPPNVEDFSCLVCGWAGHTIRF